MKIYKWTFSFTDMNTASLLNFTPDFYNHNSHITKIILKENLLFIQDELMQIIVLEVSQNIYQQVSFDIALQTSVLFDGFYFNGFFYLITK